MSTSKVKARIAVDVDSTLYDFSTCAREGFTRLFDKTGDKNYLKGAYASWVEWRSPADVCGVEAWLDVIELCHQPEVIAQQEPFPGAVSTMQALVDEGYQLMYISNRATDASDATREWLGDHGFPLVGQELVCMMDDKAPYMKACQYLFDDRPKTLVEFVYKERWSGDGRRGFGIMHEYNRALTDLPGICLAPTWAGLNYYLVSKGLLPQPAYQALGA